MFIVEWLKDTKEVHREAMLGSNVDDVLRVAIEEVPKLETRKLNPDTIRIYDASCNKTTVHKLGARDA